MLNGWPEVNSRDVRHEISAATEDCCCIMPRQGARQAIVTQNWAGLGSVYKAHAPVHIRICSGVDGS